MQYPISFALQIGPAALENPDGFRDVVRIVLEEVKAAGMDCPVTVAPAAATVAPAATVTPATVAPAPATVAPTAPRGPWENNYRVALQCGLRLTREQNSVWLAAPSKMQPAIREAIAQMCCEHGKENGVLRPMLKLTAESESGFTLELPDTAPATVAPAPAAAESEEDWQEPPCQLEEIDTAALFE